MIRPLLPALGLSVALALHPAGAARADQTDSATFTLSLLGLTAGTLTINGKVEGNRYGVTGRLQSGGLVSMIRKISYDAEASGRLAADRFTPSRYVEAADTGKRKTRAVMDYDRGVPQLKEYDPPRKAKAQDIDPATQGGTVDPLTAAYAVLRDVPAEGACTQSLDLFDGKRRTAVTLKNPRPHRNGGLMCDGEYRRVAGFDADDMAEASRFPFTLVYAPLSDGRLRVVEVAMDTIYGKGRLTRR
ncbi:DUF3108 domain-containing protein [Frigidibacter sp. MR17.14]|uniref:DUF3108 domain-containing protein n=1 Tax=Frigidibacter sp. MR17.14 TaxID=3126509 RepID=UPI003012BE50